jgi:hypothetical protein
VPALTATVGAGPAASRTCSTSGNSWPVTTKKRLCRRCGW